MSSCYEWTTCGFAIVSIIVSSIAIIVAYKTQKRYLAGNVQLVKEALNPTALEQVADIIAEAKKIPNENVALVLYSNGKYAVVNKAFQDLNIACALIYDNALPIKVIACAKESVKCFLSRHQILEFVKGQKDMYPELNRLVNELKDKSNA